MTVHHRRILLKVVLGLGSLYYFIGALAHYFGLTIFPFFDKNLYVPYQDSLIAMAAVIIALLLLIIAKEPVHNRDTLRGVIVGAVMISIFNIAILWKVDFVALGASAKKVQIIFEAILGFMFAGVLFWLYPRKIPDSLSHLYLAV